PGPRVRRHGGQLGDDRGEHGLLTPMPDVGRRRWLPPSRTRVVTTATIMTLVAVLLSGATASAQAEPSRAKTRTGTIFGLPERAGATEEEDRLDPDRPHFPEASTTVGKGRVMLESGYTWSGKGGSTSSHSVPEAVLRIGLFAEWFELRLGDNLVRDEHVVGRGASAVRWVDDVYLGVKL